MNRKTFNYYKYGVIQMVSIKKLESEAKDIEGEDWALLLWSNVKLYLNATDKKNLLDDIIEYSEQRFE